MIKEWFTARELAEFTLPNMPKTLRAYQLRADRENWTTRIRKGSGGGKEYHSSSLPEEAQIALVERLIGTEAINKLSMFSTAIETQKEKQKFTNDDRRNAKIIIVGLFDKFRASSGLKILAAEQPFLKFYKAQAADKNSTFVPNWVAEIYPEFSIPTLRLWRQKRNSDASFKNLTSKYGNRKGTGVLDRAENGEVAEYIAALITSKPHLTSGHVRDFIRSRFGQELNVFNSKTGTNELKPLPEISTFKRHIAKWKNENEDVLLKLTNPDGFKNKHQVSFGKADAGVTRLNQRWEIDASPVDALCTDGRYNLYAIVDVYSRRSMFMVSKTPCTEASLLIIRKAIMEWGVPEVIKTDNGADFISKRFQTALIALGIEQETCSPFSPEQKPFVERVIGTLQRDVMPVLPGFVGHSVADRKKIEASKAFSIRLGEKDKDAFAIQMSSEQLQSHLDDWASHKYERTTHSALGTSPCDKANQWQGAIKSISNERALDLLLAPIASGEGWRTVSKKGIRVERGSFIAPELALHIGKQVFVRHDPSDMGLIYVFDQEENFICEAFDPERRGIDRNQVSAMAKEKKKADIKEKTKEIKRLARSIKPENMIDDYLRHHIEESDNVAHFPKPKEKHTSKALEEAGIATSTPETKIETRLTDRQKNEHQKLVAELSQPKPIVINALDTREGRFKRALNLEERVKNNTRISSEDHQWLEGYKTLPEYRAQKSMMEDFGSSWFEKGERNEP
ncbi:MAG: hypothetical protein CBB87_08195 [Micavibrio sp. TMED27]|nr:transposase [Micavibrio sp.]OUT90651.1 MAG: hypothetical protein CBB87_08195 [Micavibrio sp. TMED27]|tara:strand:+ start:546 stop:2756 length:2211 start_codon:yes stop_codon:yes gene_type:complete